VTSAPAIVAASHQQPPQQHQQPSWGPIEISFDHQIITYINPHDGAGVLVVLAGWLRDAVPMSQVGGHLAHARSKHRQ